MVTVVVYEDDRITMAGYVEFDNWEDAEHYARLNMPCQIMHNGIVFDSYDMED